MSRSAMIEGLEDRRLLSVSPLAAAKIPSMVGTFTGHQIYSSGVNIFVTLRISRQHGGTFSGAVVESSGITGNVTGTINRKNVVRFVERGTHGHRFSSVFVGTLATDTLSATFTKSASALNFHGSISATRTATTTT